LVGCELIFLCHLIILDLSTSDTGTPTTRYRAHVSSIFRVLLHRSTRRNYRRWSIPATRCSYAVPWIPNDLHHDWCPIPFSITKTTFYGPLPLAYSAIWGTKWSVFVDYGVKTH
jgi:hypothetical protein